MSWSLRLGRLLGIDVYVHVTFFLLLLFVLISGYAGSGDLNAAIGQVLFVILVFAIVVMHEYGHALMARRFGVATRDITLLPIGGIARLERIPENPLHEFLIAIAGPAVNVVLALLCLPWIRLTGAPGESFTQQFLEGGLVTQLFMVNVMLVVFNMIPAFPMDGGRVLRSLLAMNMDYVRATQVAAWVGQMFALLFGLVGLFGPRPLLIFIALMVWMGASQEASMVATRASLAGMRVMDAMMTRYRAVSPYDTLEMVAGHVLAGFQQDFPVVENERVVGVITRHDMLAALAQKGRETTVGDVMQREFAVAKPQEPLNEIFPRLQECRCHSMPVLDGDRLVGLISTENVGELIMIRSAVRGNRPVA